MYFNNYLINYILIIGSITLVASQNQRRNRNNYQSQSYQPNQISNRDNDNQRRQYNRGNEPVGYPTPRNLNRNRTPHHSRYNLNANKCKIMIPDDVQDKFEPSVLISRNRENKMVQIEICCDGYEPLKIKHNTYCLPNCSNCQNGICVSPEECECHEGFVKNDNEDCIFTCPLGCLNGRCYLDGTCECDSGYKLDETRKYCRPICHAGCGQVERYNCTEPGVCACSKDYQLTEKGCEPVCDPDCGIGGECTSENPDCRMGGDCTEKIHCECKEGFTLKDGVCQSECYQTCENGVCYQRNRCLCNAGFEYHERSRNCYPVKKKEE